jgi:hypothetical protein
VAGGAAWSEGNDSGGRRPGVVVGSSRRSARGVVEAIGEGLERRYGGGRSGEVVKEEEKGAPRWRVAPFIAARGGGRRWAGKRRQRPLSEGSRRGLDTVDPWFRPGG